MQPMVLKLLQQSQPARGIANLLGLVLLLAELQDQHNVPLCLTTCIYHPYLTTYPQCVVWMSHVFAELMQSLGRASW